MRLSSTILSLLFMLALQAQHEIVQSPLSIAVNRLPARASLYHYNSVEEAAQMDGSLTNIISLDGSWRFLFRDRPAEVLRWNQEYAEDPGWGDIEVPGNWEMQGYGSPI
ncbi:MAG: hypothetical protein AAFY91_09595, partial [Bacteroidota bacterium]